MLYKVWIFQQHSHQNRLGLVCIDKVHLYSSYFGLCDKQAKLFSLSVFIIHMWHKMSASSLNQPRLFT